MCCQSACMTNVHHDSDLYCPLLSQPTQRGLHAAVRRGDAAWHRSDLNSIYQRYHLEIARYEHHSHRLNMQAISALLRTICQGILPFHSRKCAGLAFRLFSPAVIPVVRSAIAFDLFVVLLLSLPAWSRSEEKVST